MRAGSQGRLGDLRRLESPDEAAVQPAVDLPAADPVEQRTTGILGGFGVGEAQQVAVRDRPFSLAVLHELIFKVLERTCPCYQPPPHGGGHVPSRGTAPRTARKETDGSRYPRESSTTSAARRRPGRRRAAVNRKTTSRRSGPARGCA